MKQEQQPQNDGLDTFLAIVVFIGSIVVLAISISII